MLQQRTENIIGQETDRAPTAPLRLFEIDYICAFCGARHTAEAYFACSGDAPAQDLDSLHAGAMAQLKDERTALIIIKGHAIVHHHDAGDLNRYDYMGFSPEVKTFTVLGIIMTGEAGFLCDQCSTEFPDLAERWLHMGRHPRNGHKVGTYACEPATSPSAHSYDT